MLTSVGDNTVVPSNPGCWMKNILGPGPFALNPIGSVVLNVISPELSPSQSNQNDAKLLPTKFPLNVIIDVPKLPRLLQERT